MNKRPIKQDVKRFLVFAVLAFLCFVKNPYFQVTDFAWFDLTPIFIARYVLGFLSLIAVVTHVTRVLLFPYIDLHSLFDLIIRPFVNAEDGKHVVQTVAATKIAAAVVFFGFCLVISVSIFVSGQFFAAK